MERSPGEDRRPLSRFLLPVLAAAAGLAAGWFAWPEADASRQAAAIESAAAEFRVDPALVRAIVLAESGGRPGVTSGAGAVGLMQLLPETAGELGPKIGIPDPDLTDPETNVRIGTCHLARLLASFEGEVPLAVAAYNAGERRVREWAESAPNLSAIEVVDALAYDETRHYVHRVLAFQAR